jgi:hypothetical protein
MSAGGSHGRSWRVESRHGKYHSGFACRPILLAVRDSFARPRDDPWQYAHLAIDVAWECGREAIVDASSGPDAIEIPGLRWRLKCTECRGRPVDCARIGSNIAPRGMGVDGPQARCAAAPGLKSRTACGEVFQAAPAARQSSPTSQASGSQPACMCALKATGRQSRCSPSGSGPITGTDAASISVALPDAGRRPGT